MQERQISDWLAAERAGRDDLAEKVLGELLRALPEHPVPFGFAGRVLVDAGVVLSWRLRAAIGGSLMAAGLAAAFVLPLVLGLLGRIRFGDVLAVVTNGFATAVSALDEMVAVWRFLAQLRESLWLVISTPPVALTLTAMVLVAVLAFRGLSELLSPQRSPGYA